VNGTLNVQTGAGYTLSVSPAQNIQQGQSASYTISMAPAGTGFNGTVTLNMGAITGGVTGSLSTTVISAGSPATLTLTAASNASLGTYPILVNGIATTGTITHSVLAVLAVAMGTSQGGTATAGGTVTIGTVAVPPGVPGGITVSSPVLLSNGAVCSMSQGSAGITAMPNVLGQTITFTATSSAVPATATCATGAPEPAPQYVQVPCIPEDLIDLSVTSDGPGIWDFDVSSDDPDVLVTSMLVSIPTRTPSGQYTLYFLSAPPAGDNDFTVYWAAGAPCGTYNVAMAYYDDNYDDGPIFANASADLCYEEGSAPLQATTSPARVVAGAGSQFSVTAGASGGSPGYSYAWSLISTQAGDDPTVAQFCNAQGVCSTTQLGPNCSPQSTCTATIQGVKGGKATLQATVTDSASNQTIAQTRLIIVQITTVSIVATNSIGAPTATSNSSSTQPLPFGALLWPASLWAAPTPIVLIRDLPSVTVVVTSTPPANDPDVQISFDSARASDDAVGAPTDKLTLTPGTNPPTIPPTAGTINTATFTLNQTGSFQILAYLDANSNGVRDPNETGAALPVVLVLATLDSQNGNRSVATPHFSYQALSNAGGILGFTLISTTGSWSITNALNAAIHLLSQVNLLGGGANGLRGINQVFGAWVQVATTNPSAVGSYQGSHQMVRVEADNGSAASANYAGTPVFEGTDVPHLISAPLLDTNMASPGTGANSSAMGSSLLTSMAPLSSGLGQGNTYEAVDGPRISLPIVDIAYPQSELTSIQAGYGFTDSLVLWSNVSGNSGPTGDAFDHRYGVILEQPWSASGTLSVDANQNGTVTASAGGLGQSVIHSPVVALPSTAVTTVMLGPTTIILFTFDARN
jgi:hypothetical protein